MKVEKNWIKQKQDFHNAITVVQNLILQLKLDISEDTLKESLLNEPSYPSMEAICNTLSNFSIDNLVVNIKDYHLQEIEYPAIAQLQESIISNEHEIKIHFVLVTNISSSEITYINTETGWTTESIDDFVKKWTGIMLLVSTDELSGDVNYKSKVKSEKLNKKRDLVIKAIIALLILSPYLVKSNFSTWIPLLILKSIGVFFTYVLLLKQINIDNSLVTNVCSFLSNKKNKCSDEVLKSPGSKLFGWLSFSEIGMIYFIGGVISLSLGIISENVDFILSLLAIINISALPYTFYSIYYQAFKVKKYCSICLIVLLTLWLEFFMNYEYLTLITTVSINTVLVLFWSFFLTILTWLILAPLLKLKTLHKTLKTQLNAYQTDISYIESIVNNESNENTIIESHDIILGNREAKIELILYTNPYCQSCKHAHNEIDHLLKKHGSKFKIIIRFLLSSDTLMNNKFKNDFVIPESDIPVLVFLLLWNKNGDETELINAMALWFDNKDNSNFEIENWLMQLNIDKTNLPQMYPLAEIIENHAQKMNVTVTPTLFLNNHKLSFGILYLENIKNYLDKIN